MDFYDELLKSDKFCTVLGRLILTSGKLESILKIIVKKVERPEKLKVATLGKLIGMCEKHQLIDDCLMEVLGFITTRRNYLTHSLFPLFNGEIEETLLPKENLEPEDADFHFSKCVEDLISDMEFVISELSTVKSDKNKKINKD
jgi:hypothetical protein